MPIELRLPGEGDDAFRKRAENAARYARVLIDSALATRAIRALIDDRQERMDYSVICSKLEPVKVSGQITPMERQFEFPFREENVCKNVSTAESRELVRELLSNPSAYASRKRVSVVHEGSLSGRPCITGVESAKKLFGQYWLDNPGNDQERFVVACLDTKKRVQSVVLITIGTLDASLIHPREVFKPAILEGSSSIILSHNHPSGDTTPSREDREVTARLKEAGQILGIDVLDHIIYGDGTNDIRSINDTDE